MKKTDIPRLTLSAMFLALGFVLPFLTGQNPQIGAMLLPMHLPAILCGFVCSWPYGLAVGFLMPVVRSAFLGMPPMMPTALAMAFELAAYGGVAGLLYGKLHREPVNVYGSLIAAMLCGRAAWGLASLALYAAFTNNAFTLALFWAGAFGNALPGILGQLALVPLIVFALERMKLIPLKRGAQKTTQRA